MGTTQRQPTTDEWGVTESFQDALGNWHETSEETKQAIHKAMGAASKDDLRQSSATVVFVEQGTTTKASAGELILEDQAKLEIVDLLPADLPLGYHSLKTEKGTSRVIVHPKRCYLPEALHTWGWAVQLYGLRSAESWGIGDLSDLGKFASWSKKKDAGILLVNPLHAPNPTIPQQASPYYPSTRRYRNPLYLRIEAVPGANAIASEIEPLAREGQALNLKKLIDRDAVFRLKMKALETLWRTFKTNDDFARYCTREGSDLEMFATFCALTEQHGAGWRNWPASLHHPTAPAIKEFQHANTDRIRFHMWIQWLTESQLLTASQTAGIMQDLPIGVDPGGADAWIWQDLFALEAGVGAPPDEYNTQGQNWGLPPFIPHKLRGAAYEPFIQTIRATLRGAGGLRIDHVMGLFRLYWIPNGLKGDEGTYVRYNADELLAITALESHRAKAFVVGEDLGTIEESTRTQLADSRVLSYRLLWFEEDPPSKYPAQALAAITTHDLPTIAGLWSGSDLEAQKDLGLCPNEKGTMERLERLRKETGLEADADISKVVLILHEELASAPCHVITACLDDALMVQERPNMPATTEEKRPNWSIALPKSLEEIMSDPLVEEIGEKLAHRATQT
jgi:4-alpha-glucanotransferase